MKKYIFLGAATLAMLVGALMLPQLLGSYLPNVMVTSLKEKTYSSSVSSSGSVVLAGQTDVSTDYPIVPKSVECKEGSYVKKGDTLIVVDRQATVDQLLGLGEQELSGISSAFSSQLFSMISQYSSADLVNLLPNTITASEDGKVVSVSTSVGTMAFPGETLLSVSDSEELTVTLAISEDDISAVAVGQTVKIIPNAQKNRTYAGQVSEIAPAARKQLIGTAQQTVVDATVRLTNADAYLKPGYTVKAEIETEPEKTISVLPYDSVLQDSNGKEFVYVYRDGKAVKRFITTGVELDESVQVVSGIYPSDNVIYEASKISDEGNFISVSGRVGS